MSTAILPFFPSLVHYTDIENFSSIKDELVDYVYQERKEDVEGRVISNAGGWQSNELNHKGDNILKRVVASGLREIFNPTDFQPVAYEIQSLWININKKGNHNNKHLHSGSDMAGVLWINTPKNSGALEWDNPNLFGMPPYYSEEIKEKYYHFGAYWYNPIGGRLFLFPSYLYHRVHVSKTSEDRISVSFNLRLMDINWMR